MYRGQVGCGARSAVWICRSSVVVTVAEHCLQVQHVQHVYLHVPYMYVV